MRVINGGKSPEGQVVELKAQVATLKKEQVRLKGLLNPKKKGMTIEQGREFVDVHRESGITCPLCDQKITAARPRPLSSFIKELVVFANTKGDHEGWFKVHGLFPGGDYAKMEHWNFIERGASGLWRITDVGRAFLRGEVKVREAAIMQGKKFIRFTGREVTIKDLLSERAIKSARTKK